MKIKQITRYLNLLLTCLIVVVAGFSAVYAQSEAVMLIGEINDTHQLVTDGEIYDIADTPLGDDLALNYSSMRVKVEGTIRPGEELKVITVKSFEVVDE